MEEAVNHPPRLKLRNIYKSFGATQALRGVSLQVPPGVIHALIGVNGAGKSTLMRILAGAETADSGQIEVDGKSLSTPTPCAARKAGVGMIYQELSLAGHLTVAQNIVLGSEPSRCGILNNKAVSTRARKALKMLEHNDIPLDSPVAKLSIAHKQVVEIGRALTSGCRILVLDEPTSSLAQKDIEKLFSLLQHLRKSGIAIIYISHVLEEIKRIADCYTVLRDGQVAGCGNVKEVSTTQLITLMSGRKHTAMFPAKKHYPQGVLLSCRNVSGRPLPRDATFELRRGEVLGLAGTVGAGRSELLRLIAGIAPLSSGTITIGGVDGWQNAHRRMKQGIGLLSEDRKTEGLAMNLTVADNMTLSKMNRCGRAGTVWPPKQARLTRRLIQQLDIRTTGPQQTVKALSGGNQQKIAVARLLFHDCEIFLLDEPTRGIDVKSKQQIYRLINDLAAGQQDGKPRAILLASSYLPELLGLCDRIAVMFRGRLGPAKPAEEWTEHELMLHTTGGGNEQL